jgi:hypothetical protein
MRPDRPRGQVALRAAVAVLFLSGAGSLVAAAALARPVPAAAGARDPANCTIRDAGGQCVATNHRSRPPSPGGASSRGPLRCEYLAFEDQAYGYSLFPPPENPVVDGIIVYEDCGRPAGNGRYDPWEEIRANGSRPDFIGPVSIARPVPWADPAEVAEDLLADVIANLPAPVPVISPPPTGAAVIDVPTFVSVGNWPGVIGPLPSCDGPVCIELTAVPRLVFTPGDGTDPVTCAGAGTLFDPSPDAPEPDVQAEGACAHTYDRRTAGQPWPGTLAIHWEVIWTSLTPDDDGVIDVIPQGVPVPRQVDEVQGIVIDAGIGER